MLVTSLYQITPQRRLEAQAVYGTTCPCHRVAALPPSSLMESGIAYALRPVQLAGS
jgi:hypothetical protein